MLYSFERTAYAFYGLQEVAAHNQRFGFGMIHYSGHLSGAQAVVDVIENHTCLRYAEVGFEVLVGVLLEDGYPVSPLAELQQRVRQPVDSRVKLPEGKANVPADHRRLVRPLQDIQIDYIAQKHSVSPLTA